MNELTYLSISQFKRRRLDSAVCYGDDIIITDNITDMESFKHPCRIDAVTILVCTSGTIDCSVNLRRYQIERNTILMILPPDIIQLHQASGVSLYAVVISSEYFNSLLVDFGKRSESFLQIRQNAVAAIPHEYLHQLKRFYELMHDCILNPAMEGREIVRSLTRALIYAIMSFILTYCEKPLSTDTRGKQIFDRFLALLNVHHLRERSVRFYADSLFLTPNYMSGAVKLYSGKSALEWINDYVVLEAKNMLGDTTMSIKEIAYRLNFTTQSAFGKYFKEQTGISPKHYRSRFTTETHTE